MIKTLAGMAASVGVSQVVGNIITATTPGDLSKYQKVATIIGRSVVLMVAQKTVAPYVEESIDDIGRGLNNLKDVFIKKGE